MAKDRVLIVEDDKSLILFYKGILAALDIKIDTAASYSEALTKLKEFDYIFHVIDITLDGDEPGTELIGKAGAGPDSCLIVSASMTEVLVRELIDVHGIPRAQIITKPVDADRLVDMVTTRLDASSNDVNGNDNPVHNNVEDAPAPRSRFHAEVIVFRYIVDYFADHKLRTIAFVIFLMVFLNFLITFLKIDAYNEIDNQIRSRNDKLFQHHNEGRSLSATTYIEVSGFEIMKFFNRMDEATITDPDVRDLYDYINARKGKIKHLKIKFYPNDNYLVIISDDKSFRHYWIPDREYLTGLGVGQDLSFWQVFIKAWAASFKNF